MGLRVLPLTLLRTRLMPLPDKLPYFPRPDLLQNILRLLLSGANVALFAPRRHGKTQFVRNELLPAVHEAGWFAARVDLWRNRSHPALGLVEGLEAIAYAARNRRTALSTHLNLKSVRTKFKTPGVDIEGEWVPADATPSLPEAPLENRLANAMHLIADHGEHALLALDEFQALVAPGTENFIATFRTVLQDLEDRLSVIFTGSSREGLNRLFQRAKAPLFRSAESVALPNMGDDFVDSRADYLAATAGLQVDRDALKLIYPRLRHTPQFLNEIVRGMLVSGDADVPGAYKNWLDGKQQDEYADLISNVADVDFAVVLWLATSGETSVYTADARKAMAMLMSTKDAPTAAKIQTAIRRLTQAGIVDPLGVTGSYELADQGLQIVLRELAESTVERHISGA
jgi:hypothetical protein